MDVELRVDCRAWLGPLRRIWASIGYDEINWTYTGRGRALYRTLRDLAETPYHVRNHNALTSGNGLSEPARGSTNVYQEAPDGSPVYDWTIVDRLYDVIVGAGFHPVVELGFLPRDLVPVTAAAADWLRDVGRETYEVDGLWKHPPRDFERWEALVERFVAHCVDRYGRAAVERWWFEVWNEPDIPNYWRGTFEDYCRLYDHAVAGAVRALPSVRIGGPATTGPADPAARAFLERFLAALRGGRERRDGRDRHPARLRVVSHEGRLLRAPAHLQLAAPVERQHPSSGKMLRDIRAGLEAVAAVPALAGLPVVVDECDPAVGTIYGVHDNPSFVVTNSEYYPTFLCALVKRVLDLDRGFGDRIAFVTTWAFYMEGKRWFEGNRTLVTNENVEKPILNGLRMLGRLAETRVAATSTREPGRAVGAGAGREVDALAAIDAARVTVLVWHQTDPWWEEGEATVSLTIEGLPFSGPATVRHWRIDGQHSNAYAEWRRQGSPEDPSPAQIARLRSRQGLELLAPRPPRGRRRWDPDAAVHASSPWSVAPGGDAGRVDRLGVIG